MRIEKDPENFMEHLSQSRRGHLDAQHADRALAVIEGSAHEAPASPNPLVVRRWVHGRP